MAVKRLEFLDALRGLAASYVIVYHMLHIPQPNTEAPNWAFHIAHWGGTGVTLFFVVSAFSLFYTMPLRLEEASPCASFYLHRLCRIAPLFYLWIVLSFARDWLLFAVQRPWWSIVATGALVFNFIPGLQEGVVWAGWTIGVEILFYALFPLIYRRVRNVWAAGTLVLGCIGAWMVFQASIAHLPLAAEVQQPLLSKWFFLRHLPIFACGSVCYFLLRDPLVSGMGKRQRRLGLLLTPLALCAYAATVSGQLGTGFADSYYWQGFLYSVLLVGLALNPVRPIVNRLTCYLGKLSYSLYLNHPTVVFLLSPVYQRIYAAAPNVSVAFLASYGLTLAIVVAVSALTYRFVEEPGIRLGKRLYRGWAARPTGLAIAR
ncbi:MAG: acyltransferase [Candidatus Binatia bacterium]